MTTEYISIEDMRNLCHRLAVTYFDASDDPIPPFDEHNPALLESALNLPRQTYDGNDLYPLLVDKAVILYYALIKNHAFPNGNKRLATAALLIFLFINGKWLREQSDKLAEQTIRIAESAPTHKDQILEALTMWITKHMIEA